MTTTETITTEQLLALVTPQLRQFIEQDSANNGLDRCAFQVYKRFLPELPHAGYDTHHDLVYLVVLGTDPNYRGFGK
jgi:ribosomal protein S18 acetylase RimI-like enzyme